MELKNIIKSYVIILQIIFCFGVTSAQYPIFDHFTSIGGPGEWVTVTSQPDMCAHVTYLCPNCTNNYLTGQYYSFESPNYGTQFLDDGCDSMYVEFALDMNIRNSDQLQFWWFDGTWNGLVVPSSGIWYVYVPNTTQLFSFDFITGLVGSTLLRYVHIDYIYIDCETTLLPIELNNFKCNTLNVGVGLAASVSDSTDIELQWSNDGYSDWVILNESYSIDLIYHHKTSYTDNYYRLKVDNIISNTLHCRSRTKSPKPKKINYYNVLGQPIPKPIGYYIESTIYDDGGIENKINFKKLN
tara:strand:- start:2126 stop:3019 length:894 start_codon:yes stop_codon:yes gene_type:complete